ncbi:hypothetical protein ACFOSC_19485 [Streptantibioticus rubrisoli]|uniref:Uncharacterized protein n=1 Tax=Streptantibioticus rubrisoli TaxID=1387313 RepID=A0ABT1PLY7_9ACTN|nr:hypothetical protein [Streptantibioticus rubrisoli]MCQ4046375.1 hypothetical protein [Streptantibioticus rubrisoli]
MPVLTLRRTPTVRLALSDGVERDYLLDTPASSPATGLGGPVYDRLVHAAYVLARQGYDAHWLTRFAQLPFTAAHRITEAAAHASR